MNLLKNTKLLIIISGCILGVSLISIGVYFTFLRNKNVKEENSDNNKQYLHQIITKK